MSGVKMEHLSRGIALGLTIMIIAFVSVVLNPADENKVRAANQLPALKMSAVQGYTVESTKADGLATYKFTTPRGNILANFTDDLAASDTLTGTVEAEPAGKTPAEISENQGELNGMVVEVARKSSPVADKVFMRTLPSVVTSAVTAIVLKYKGKEVARGELPVFPKAPSAPTDVRLPMDGQLGRPVSITCPGGKRSTEDSLKIGDTTLRMLAESPRKSVFLNKGTTIGMNSIEFWHNGAVKRGEFRNISLSLSSTRTNLKRGGKATLILKAEGLEGLKSDMPLEILNRSPEIINMKGGVDIRSVIQPGDVRKGGEFLMELALTGIMAGSFNIYGTVWADWPFSGISSEAYGVRPYQHVKGATYCVYSVTGSSGGGALGNGSTVCIVCAAGATGCRQYMTICPAPGIYYDLELKGTGCSSCPSGGNGYEAVSFGGAPL